MNVLSPLFQKVVSIGMSVLCSASILTSTGYTKPVVAPAHNIVVTADKLISEYSYSNPTKEAVNEQTTENNTPAENVAAQDNETEAQKNEQAAPAENGSQEAETPAEELVAFEEAKLEVIDTFDISATPEDDVTMTLYAAPKNAAYTIDEDETDDKSTVRFDEKKISSYGADGEPQTVVTAVISGSGEMEENVYRHFVNVEMYIDAAKEAFAEAYGLNAEDIRYNLPEDVNREDFLEVDSEIEYYATKESKAGPAGTVLEYTDEVREALNPADAINFSPDSIEFEGNVTSISDCAFLFCKDLTEVEVPSSVKYIGANAFAYCDNLTKITLNEGLEEIYSGAFMHCDKLMEIVLPSTLNYIGYGTFEFMKNSSRIICPNQEVYNLIDFEYAGVEGRTNVVVEGPDNGINYGDLVVTNPDDWFNF